MSLRPQEGEEPIKKKICEFVNDVFVMAMSLAMIIIGANHDNEEDCKIAGVTLYLQVGGSLSLTFTGFYKQLCTFKKCVRISAALFITVLNLIARTTPCKLDDKIMLYLGPVVGHVQLCIVIWGSVVVFGKSDYSNCGRAKWEFYLC